MKTRSSEWPHTWEDEEVHWERPNDDVRVRSLEAEDSVRKLIGMLKSPKIKEGRSKERKCESQKAKLSRHLEWEPGGR